MGKIKELLIDRAELTGDWDYDYAEYLQRWSDWTDRMIENGRKARNRGVERHCPSDPRFIALHIEIAFAEGTYSFGTDSYRILVDAWHSGWDGADADLARIAEHEETMANYESPSWIAAMYS